MNCNRCGAPLPPGVATCPNCGNATPYNVSGDQYNPTIAAPSPYTPQAGVPPVPPTAYGAPPPAPGGYDPYSNAGAGTYPQPPSDPYSAPQQQNLYAPPPAPPAYGGFQPPPSTPPRRGNRTLLIVGIVVLILLLACITGSILVVRGIGSAANNVLATATAAVATASTSDQTTPTTAPTSASSPTAQSQGPSPSGSPIATSAAAIIISPQMASQVNGTTPTQFATTFTVQQKVYATFKLAGQDGYLNAYWYLDGAHFFTNTILHATASDDQGFFAAHYPAAGQGAVELYWCTQANCSDRQLAQVMTFTITASSTFQAPGQGAPAVSSNDRDIRRQ